VRLPGFPVSFKLWGPRKARPEVAWLEGVGGTSKGGLGKDVAGKSQRMLAAAAWPEKCDSHRGDDAVRQVRGSLTVWRQHSESHSSGQQWRIVCMRYRVQGLRGQRALTRCHARAAATPAAATPLATPATTRRASRCWISVFLVWCVFV